MYHCIRYVPLQGMYHCIRYVPLYKVCAFNFTPVGPWEIDGLPVPPGKAYNRLIDPLITDSLPRKSGLSNISLMVIFKAHCMA